MGPRTNQLNWGLAICIWIAAPAVGLSQFTAQLPNPWQGNTQPGTYFPQTSIPQPSFTAPTMGGFDPNAPTFRPSTAPPVYSGSIPYGAYPQNSGWNFGNLFGFGQPTPNYPIASPYGAAGIPTTPQTFGQPMFGQTAYPPSVYPNNSPGVLFPGVAQPPNNSIWNQQNPYLANPYQTSPFGLGQSSLNWNNWWNNAGNNLSYGSNQVIRLFQGPRFRHTWLPGTNGFSGKKSNSLESNDSDVSLVFALPNFLNSTRPLYIIPSYSQHEWDGPTAIGSDLPGSAFSGFIDSGWETNPQQTLGYGARFASRDFFGIRRNQFGQHPYPSQSVGPFATDSNIDIASRRILFGQKQDQDPSCCRYLMDTQPRHSL